MEFYASLAATASRLLEKYGKAITFKRETAGSYDPVTGATVAGTITTHTPNGIFQTIRSDLIDGTRIQSGDKMFVIDSSFEPVLSDKVVISGADWSIQEVTPSQPADTTLVYFVLIRK